MVPIDHGHDDPHTQSLTRDWRDVFRAVPELLRSKINISNIFLLKRRLEQQYVILTKVHVTQPIAPYRYPL